MRISFARYSLINIKNTFNLFSSTMSITSSTQTSSASLTSLSQTEAKMLIEKGKKASAFMAVDENVNRETRIVGVGSGSTIVYAVERLGIYFSLSFFLYETWYLVLFEKNVFFIKAERIKSENLDIICIPSSFQSKQLLIKHDLKISDLEAHTKIDLTVDGADEVDKDLTCIKGGGACHLQEKLIAFCAKKFIIIADSR